MYRIYIDNKKFEQKPTKQETGGIVNRVNMDNEYTISDIRRAIQHGQTIYPFTNINSKGTDYSKDIKCPFLVMDFDGKDVENYPCREQVINIIKTELNIVPILSYLSFSSIEEERFRLVFKFENPVLVTEYKYIYYGIASIVLSKLQGIDITSYIDFACAGNRLFYGTDKAESVIDNSVQQNWSYTITEEMMMKLSDLGIEFKEEIDKLRRKSITGIDIDNATEYEYSKSFDIDPECVDQVTDFIYNLDIIDVFTALYPNFNPNDMKPEKDGQTECYNCPIHGGEHYNLKRDLVKAPNVLHCFVDKCDKSYGPFNTAQLKYNTKNLVDIYCNLCADMGYEINQEWLVKKLTPKTPSSEKSNAKEKKKRKWKLVTQTEYCEDPDNDAPPVIVPNMFYHGGVNMLSGYEGLGKSIFASKLAYSIAEGKMPFDNCDDDNLWSPCTKQNVIYVCYESTLKDKCISFSLNKSSNMFQLKIADDEDLPNLLDDEDFDTLVEMAEEVNAKVIFIDPFYLSVTQKDFLDGDKMTVLIKKCNNLYKKKGITFILVHHNTLSYDGDKSKSPKSAGTSLLQWGLGDQWTMLEVPSEIKEEIEPERQQYTDEGLAPPQYSRLMKRKLRHGENLFDNLIIRMDRNTNTITYQVYIPERTTVKGKKNGSTAEAIFGEAVSVIKDLKDKKMESIKKKEFVELMMKRFAVADMDISYDSFKNHYSAKLYKKLSETGWITFNKLTIFISKQ